MRKPVLPLARQLIMILQPILSQKILILDKSFHILNFVFSGYKGPGQKGYLDQRGQHLPPAYTPHLPEHYLKVDSGHNLPGYY